MPERAVTAGLPYSPPRSDAEAEGERLTRDEAFGPGLGRAHVARYHLAAGFCPAGTTVLDAACGVGYGAEILAPEGSRVAYVGVDRRPPDEGWPIGSGPWTAPRRYITADLANPPTSGLAALALGGYDVAVSFETLEHLVNPAPLIRILMNARRYLVASVPIGVTTDVNPWHLTDWEPGQLQAMIEGMDTPGRPDWTLLQSFTMVGEPCEVVVMTRRSIHPTWGSSDA